MSLINDALKRAEADKPRAAHTSAPVPALQAVDVAPAPKTSPVLIGGVLLLGIGAIGIAAALWFNGTSKTQVANSNVPQPAPEPTQAELAVAARGTQATPPAQSPAAAQTTPITPAQPAQIHSGPQPAPRSTPQSAPTAQPATLASTPATVGTAPSLPPSSSVPKPRTTTASATQAAPATNSKTATDAKPIRLQSIFYRFRGPTVIINGKTLGVGDSVDGVKVVSIQRTSVEIVQNGEYRTLTLQD